MTARTVIGVDPGGARTGIAVRRGRELLAWELLERVAGESLRSWATRCSHHVSVLAIAWQPDVCGVEGLNEPTPHMGLTNLRGTLDTAVALGAVLSIPQSSLDVVEVPPAGFSKTATQPRRVLEQLFPAALVTTPLVALKDCRAAWLVAEAALLQQRVEAAP